MELHHQLLSLTQQRGPAIMDQPAQLRAALEDHLDESAASTGDLNLLSDAVRLGGIKLLRTTLQGGAAPASAVEAAGDYLARQRGSTDVNSCRWATAAIGFALGLVPDDVATAMRRRYEGGTAPSAPPAMGGWQQPVVSPLPPTLSPVQSGGPGHPGGPQHQPMMSPPQQWGPPQQQPARKSAKTPLIAVAAGVGAVLLGAGVAWAVTAGGDDDKSEGADDPTTSTSISTSPSESDSPSPDTGDVLEGRSAEEIRDAVMATMGSVSSLNMSGRIEAQDTAMDLSMDTDGRCKGTMEVEGGQASIISDGVSSYMRGDEDFWVASSGRSASELTMFVDRWVKMKSGDDSFDSFCDLDNLLDEFDSGGSADFEVRGTRIVNGTEALELLSDDGSQLMVSNAAPHHILKIISLDPADPGEFTFSRYNEELDISAPSDYLDLDSVG